MIRIIVADDHALLRRGLVQTLADEPDMHVVGEAATARELAEQLRASPCDLVILDLTMPGRSGLDLIPELRQERPGLRILVLSMLPEEQFGVPVLREGASGFVAKASAPEELVRAIRKAHAGGRYVSPALAEKLAADLAADTPGPLHESLSAREFEVLRKIGSGMTVTEIADALALSVKTVSSYRARLLQKMGMGTNAQLTAYAVRNRLVD